MIRTRLMLGILALACLSLAFAVPRAEADGVNGIEYQVTNLGSDAWQYTYTFTGPALSANQAFTVFFEPTLTSNLNDTSLDTNPASLAASSWSSFVIAGDPVLLSDGFFTALALVNGADATTDVFTVTFDFSGPGAPGAQAFSIDQFGSLGNFVSNLETGETTPFSTPVPEPGSGPLLVLAMAGLVGGVLGWRTVSNNR
jgi:hypothetical protein